MSKILIKFNIKSTDANPTWIVSVDGKESVFDKVNIYVHSETIAERIETGEIKHHILCYGQVYIKENVALIF